MKERREEGNKQSSAEYKDGIREAGTERRTVKKGRKRKLEKEEK